MASIFSFNPAPERPLSPWDIKSNTPGPGSEGSSPADSTPLARRTLRANFHHGAPRPVKTANGVAFIVPECDIGPVEYKLTLVGAHRSKERFDQLTTQLQWRLQQTTTHHAANSAAVKASPEKRASLLQETKGALYEIGVTDDGTIVGLSEEEMDESLDCLREMAHSIGCEVEILRRVKVIVEDKNAEPMEEDLCVVEALVKPGLGSGTAKGPTVTAARDAVPEQLRISFTGASMGGKSTLIGTLTSGEHDNGRGKSRLTLLRHPHEVSAGVTSCVSQEIIGYRLDGANGVESEDQVINYKADNTSCWTDIYATAASAPNGGRVVLMTDSGGAPRSRRTVMRSLIGLAPHYAFVVVPADCGRDTPEDRETMELSMAHLGLAVKLGLRLVIIFSKLDLINTAALKAVVGPINAFLKANNKRPGITILDKASGPGLNGWGDLEAGIADDLVRKMQANADIVPMFFASAVQGKGIRLLHAFLSKLPIPETCGPQVTTSFNKRPQPVKTLFHIEKCYGLTPTVISTGPNASNEQTGIVVSGYLEKGTISVNDELWVGPFPATALSNEHEHEARTRPLSGSFIPTLHTGSPSRLSIPVAHHFLSEESGSGSDSPGPSSFHRARPPPRRSPLSGKKPEEDWCKYRVVSARSCRVPVSHLSQSDIGTLGLIPIKESPSLSLPLSLTPPTPSALDQDRTERYLKKGMVLLNQSPLPPSAWPKSHTGFTVTLDLPPSHGVTPGVHTVIYTACLRAAAEVVSITPLSEPKAESPDGAGGGFFEFESDGEEEGGDGEGRVEVRLRFLARRQWVEGGAGVFVMIGGGSKVRRGRLALEGYWGEIVGVE